MKDLKEFIKDIERDLFINIVISLRHKKMTQFEAKNLSKNYLAGYPFKDSESILQVLIFLARDFKEARKVYVKYAKDYYEYKDKERLSAMRFFISKNDIDKAILAGKEVK